MNATLLITLFIVYLIGTVAVAVQIIIAHIDGKKLKFVTLWGWLAIGIFPIGSAFGFGIILICNALIILSEFNLYYKER